MLGMTLFHHYLLVQLQDNEVLFATVTFSHLHEVFAVGASQINLCPSIICFAETQQLLYLTVELV